MWQTSSHEAAGNFLSESADGRGHPCNSTPAAVWVFDSKAGGIQIISKILLVFYNHVMINLDGQVPT